MPAARFNALSKPGLQPRPSGSYDEDQDPTPAKVHSLHGNCDAGLFAGRTKAGAGSSPYGRSRLLFAARAVDTAGAYSGPPADATVNGKALHIIQFYGPIQDEWLAAVEETGAELIHYCRLWLSRLDRGSVTQPVRSPGREQRLSTLQCAFHLRPEDRSFAAPAADWGRRGRNNRGYDPDAAP